MLTWEEWNQKESKEIKSNEKRMERNGIERNKSNESTN